MKKKTPNKKILTLTTKDWNTTPPKEQDKALLFMLRVLADLYENRIHGFDKNFWAQYP